MDGSKEPPLGTQLTRFACAEVGHFVYKLQFYKLVIKTDI